MERFGAERLPEHEALRRGGIFPSRRIRKKKRSLFFEKSSGGGTDVRTMNEFSQYGRMNAFFARQAAFEKWGSKNERD